MNMQYVYSIFKHDLVGLVSSALVGAFMLSFEGHEGHVMEKLNLTT